MNNPHKPKTKKFYWDACIFLAAIKGETNRVPVIRTLLEKCERGEIEIYTSLLSVTEVAFAQNEKDARQLDPIIEESINELWAPASPIKIVEFYDLIAFGAKDLIRNSTKGWSIRPADAIHLITAQKMQIDEFHTYDKPVIKKHKDELHSFLGFSIKEPETEITLFDDLLEK